MLLCVCVPPIFASLGVRVVLPVAVDAVHEGVAIYVVVVHD
jgi:hypothetical protein